MTAPRRGVDAEHRFRLPGLVERERDELFQLGAGKQLEPQPRARALEPVEVLREAKRPAAVDTERLEGAPSAHEGLVVDVDHGLARRDEATPGDGEGAETRRHATTLTGSAGMRL